MRRLAARKGTKVVVLDVAPLFSGAGASPSTYLPLFDADRRLPLPGENVKYYKVDLMDPETIKEAAEKVLKEVGQPYVLSSVSSSSHTHGNTLQLRSRQHGGRCSGEINPRINTSRRGPVRLAYLNRDDADFPWICRTYDTNVKAHYYTVQAFLPHMIKEGKGHVVVRPLLPASSFLFPLTRVCADHRLRHVIRPGRQRCLLCVLAPSFLPSSAHPSSPSHHTQTAPPKPPPSPSTKASPKSSATSTNPRISPAPSGRVSSVPRTSSPRCLLDSRATFQSSLRRVWRLGPWRSWWSRRCGAVRARCVAFGALLSSFRRFLAKSP